MYLDKINCVIDKIEENLKGEISYTELAEIMSMSVYEFRRIFAFLVGTPLSDYIRMRRITCSLFDLQSGEYSITDIAQKYQYDSPSSFSRAFKEMQGITPSDAMQNGALLKSFPRALFTASLSGANSIDFRLMRRGEMKLCGYTGVFSETLSGCGEEVWNAYYDGGCHDRLLLCGAFEFEKAEFAAYTSCDDNSIICTIGALMPITENTPEGMSELIIPAALWGVFDVVGTMDYQINTAYYKTVTEWLSASTYERDIGVCNLEAFPIEERNESTTMHWRIYYPLLKRQLQ